MTPISRTPRLLWRFLAWDVTVILLIATLGLVGVIAFAAAMRPLAEGRVDPFDAARLAGLLAVPMLQFALPFAAGLAATLGYHRFAAENEALAAMAGGVSHRSILFPAAALGLALSLLLAVLSNEVIPRFLRGAEQLLTRDVTRFIVNPIERGETVQIGRWDIRADRVIHASGADAGRGAGATEHLVLRGVLAHQVNKPESFIEADRVDLWLFDDETADEAGGTRAVLRFDRASAYVGPDRLEAQGAFTDSLRVPSAFRDDPKYLSFRELREVERTPEMLNRIEWRRRLVADHLAMRDMIGDVRHQLENAGAATLLRRGDEFTIRARGLEALDDGWALLPAKGSAGVVVKVRLASGGTREHTATHARLSFRSLSSDQGLPAPDEDGSRVWLRLDLEDVATAGEGGSTGETRASQQQYSTLTTRSDHVAARLTQPSAEILKAAAATAPAESPSQSDRDFRRAATELRTKIDDLKREAFSKVHERLAFSASCVLMVLCGSIVALRLRDALPLQVYLWSFIPALVCVITISAGQGLTHRFGWPGLVLLWGGVAGLAGLTSVFYASLRRH
ncbi:MAG: LptF/LptG family permease [Planctomycetes bacterium]|nr:LptF/LptG family permease [Planctomycetota bacterium]